MAKRVLSEKEKRELDVAFQRVQTGKALPATAVNAGDVRNLEFARTLGYTPPAKRELNISPQTPLPMQAGEREALINRYIQGGVDPTAAVSRVDELFAGRPAAPAGATAPSQLIFAPTGERVSTTPSRSLDLTPPAAPPRARPRVNLASSWQKAMTDLLRQYQTGGAGLDENLQQQRAALIQARFGAKTDITPEQLQVLSPEQQAALRGEDVRGLETQLGGVSAALKSREAERSELRQVMDKAQDRLAALEKEERGYEFEREQTASKQAFEREKLKTGGGLEGMPASYKEWSLSGSQLPYGEWLNQQKGVGDMTPSQQRFFSTVFDNAAQDQDVKIFSSVRGSFEQGRSAYNLGKQGKAPGVGDIVLMRTIAKITDPTSAVREEEFKTFEGAQATLKRYGIALTKKMWAGDRLTDTGRDQLFSILQSIYDQRQASYLDRVNFYNTQLENAGIDSSRFGIPTYLAPGSKSTQQPTGGGDILDRALDQIGFKKVGGDTKTATQKLGSVSYRNNNPLNIKYGVFAAQYGATPSIRATDGGQFAKFPDVATGTRAAKDLLQSPSYANLSLEKAMRHWSGNGYGADVAPELKGKKIGQMTEAELNTLINKMKQREGWIPPKFA